MDDLKFDWDKSKASLNKKKHGVSFEEAVTIFYDEDALESHDPDHSEDEDRFILLGLSFRARTLVVSHCVRESGSVIRIISARKATKLEAQKYWEEKP
jgi:uncharacterized DUF497 family protein